ncbi:hypothetical protein BegalDRAFT_2371 [Beggiatoa alba B18LD]|uniref:GIY-YIG domain-containing protein n=1 Tax=Beggiatoa alba B18LD TaxID=395493 RepID=I3CHY1_9GAMM|nr:GIY-YIG nuclease family protein [Beggiatoa alba]EIJ43224.1 hypothetical protein BegalDRAFT_2371 [Beggiatoa alba B18LD]
MKENNPAVIQTQIGTYILVLQATSACQCHVGKLGQCAIAQGYYLYVGSAFGKGGVFARISHHRRLSARPHWHIDYLRLQLPLIAIWYSHDTQRREHQWASILSGSKTMHIGLPHFGASDCTCCSHLFFSETLPSFSTFQQAVMQVYPTHAPIWQSIESETETC